MGLKSASTVAGALHARSAVVHQSASTVARLRQLGVDLGQGFFIEKPSFLEDVTEEMLASPPMVLAAPDTFPEEAPDQASVSAEETLRL